MNKLNFLKIPDTDPERIFLLRDSSYANDLFIAAVAYLDIFNIINNTALNIIDLCATLKIQMRPADVLLTLLKSYNFINEINEIYTLTQLSKDFLTNNSQFDLSSYVESLKDRPICVEMLKVLQTGEPANWSSKKSGADWASSMNDDEFAESFTKSMNSRGVYLANRILDCIDFSKSKRILDIGGASGIYSAVLLSKFPNLSATVFEKSPVDKVTKYFINKYSINNMDVIIGDMFENNFPNDYDVHLISHVLHDWDITCVEKILLNSYNSLKSGGTIIIHDAHINAMKNGPISVAEYSVLLMFSTHGKCYSIMELKDLLDKIGFKNIEFKTTIINRSVIIANK
jgi:2-polyprenyl-3-methyl-5-hydroxy-6-metoxy-1,4-benzoquinol methylase